ncbi:hypothetical protein AMTRI_Chr13g84130 [Amborella trichopoda]
MASEQLDAIFFSLVSEEVETPHFSDEAYAEALQFQEVIFSSIISFLSTTTSPPSLSIAGASSSSTEETTLSLSANPTVANTEIVAAIAPVARSSSSGFFCGICMDHKTHEETFLNQGCSHRYCNECMEMHIAAKLRENFAIIGCPSPRCKQVLDSESCRSFIPDRIFERWEGALSEAAILGINKSFCPFMDCSGILEIDEGILTQIRESECPYCRRLFCANCRVPWHSGLDCDEFQRLRGNEEGKNDIIHNEILFTKLAEGNKWKKCPNCKYYVEKQAGCNHLTCRCKSEFCYLCGSQWNANHTCG